MDYVGQVITLELRAVESDWRGTFDRLEVWRSRSGPDGLYEELTAPDWRTARLPKSGGDLPDVQPYGKAVIISGKTLLLTLDEIRTISLPITGTDPLTFRAVAAQLINPLIQSYVDMDGRLVVQSAEPGNKAILRVVPTDAATLLDLPTSEPDSVAYGRDARLELTTGTEVYAFVDVHGASSNFYKTRFRNSGTGAVSDFSLPFSAQQGTRLDPSEMVLGYINLVDALGRPIQFREVAIGLKNMGQLVNDKLVMDNSRSAFTDANGYAEFLLVRGIEVVVSISGTTIARDVLVPSDPSVERFMLLDAAVGHDDNFTVRVPDLDYAVRRSL